MLVATAGALALAASLVAGNDVTKTFKGFVNEIDVASPEVRAQLEAAGVVVGAAAKGTLHINAAAAAGEPLEENATSYPDAITKMRLRVDQLLVEFDASMPALGTNAVTVDDVPAGLFHPEQDNYWLEASGVESEALLAPVGEGVAMEFTFSENDGDAIDDEGVIQVFNHFHSAITQAVSSAGTITIRWTQKNGASSNPSTSLCTKGKVLAGAKYGRARLVCRGKKTKLVPGPATDALIGACLWKANNRYLKGLTKSSSKVSKKSMMCAVGPSPGGDNMISTLIATLSPIVTVIESDIDETSGLDRELRAALFESAGRQWFAEAKAYARHATKPNDEKLVKKLGLARAQLIKRVDALVAKSESQGLVYVGPTSAAVADVVSARVETLMLLHGGTVLTP